MSEAKIRKAAELHKQAVLLQLADKYEESLTAYQAAIALTPKDAELIANLGTLYQRFGKFDKSLECFQRAFALSPTLANQCKIAEALNGQDRIDEAAEVYEAVLTKDPNNPFANYFLSLLRFKQGRMTEAWRLYEQRLHPDILGKDL